MAQSDFPTRAPPPSEIDSANGAPWQRDFALAGNGFELWSGVWCITLALDALMPTFDAAACGSFCGSTVSADEERRDG